MTFGERLERVREALGRWQPPPRVFAALVLAAAFFVWGAAAYLAVFSHRLVFGLPDPEDVRGLGNMAQSTVLYDAADAPVFTIFREQRIEVPLDRMAPDLIRAVLAVEDQRFFDHRGIDLMRIPGAALANLRAGRRAQGGSTITQQLARLSFLTRDKTVRRKLQEVLVAAHVERAFTKHEILELYLNKVYFGDGFHGVEAAARGFFGKTAAELSLEESALLAGIIKSPSTWAPTVNLQRALARRAVVLRALADSGAIDEERFRQARDASVLLRNDLRHDEPYGLYFKEQVRRELVERFGWQRVSEGGLRVYTTIDTRLQQTAEALVEESLEQIERRRGYPHPPRRAAAAGTGDASAATEETPGGADADAGAGLGAADADAPSGYLQGALVALDPHTGAVLAMVGGRDFDESPFNRAVQAWRQPGSAFKPFLFAAALEAGFTPASLIRDLDDPLLTEQGSWLPEEGQARAESMTLRTALRVSSNRAAVQLLRQVGIPRAVEYAERLRIGTPPSVPSLALGSGEVTLQSLTAGYAAFANGGLVRRPVLIRRVEDRDGTLLFRQPGADRSAARAIKDTTAFLVASMLADVVNAGTGSRARREGFVLPAGGKTGTTNRYVDAWFVGFTPRLVTGVWVGFDQPRTIIARGHAADLAVPLWARFMKEATEGHPRAWIDRPEEIVAVNVCRTSGLRPNGGCDAVELVTRDGDRDVRSLVYTDYFVRGTQPRDVCPEHPSRSFLDRLAGAFGGREARPVAAEDLGLPPASLSRPGARRQAAEPADAAAPAATRSAVRAPEATVEPEEEEKEKKRGFWSRLFGRRDRDQDDEARDPNP